MTKKKAHIFVFISSILWGITFPLSKYTLSYVTPEQLGFFRYFGAALILFAYLKFKKVSLKVSKKDLLFLFYTGVLAFFGYAYLEMKAIESISSGIVSLFIGIIPVITISLEVITRRRKLNSRTILVVSLALVGIYLVIKDTLSLGGDIRGYIYMTLAITSWIVYLFKAVESKINPLVTVAYQFGAASLLHGVGFFVTKGYEIQISFYPLLAIIYLMLVSTVVCYVMYFLAAKFLGAGIVSLYDNLVFIIGFFASAVAFSSSITTLVWISFVLILISVGLSTTLEIQKH